MPNLDNPFQKNPFGSTNVGLTQNTASFGNTTVTTTNPIVTTSKYDLPTPTFKVQKSQAQKDYEARQKVNQRIAEMQPPVTEASWWKSRTKAQRALMIGGAVVLAGIVTYVIYRNRTKTTINA